MGRQGLPIARRGLTVLLLAAAMALPPLALPGSTPVAQAATTCRTYTAIGVRGTDDGSKASMGTTLPTAVSRFTAVKGSSHVTSDYVSYPAQAIAWGTTYVGSMKAGRAALNAKLASWSSRCPSTKFALFGYSQGAHVVGDVVVGLSSTMRKKVYGVGLIGDPMFNPTLSASVTKDSKHGGMFGRRSAWPSGVYVHDVCNRGDQICASISTAQSVGYLTGIFGPPKEHGGYTGTTYSPVAGHSGAWVIGNSVASH